MLLDFGAQGLPASASVRLADLDRGLSWEVRPGQSVPVSVGAAARRLAIEVRTGPTQATDVVERVSLAPNPFAGRVGLQFVLGRGQDIRVAIFDAAGRAVRRLTRPGAGPGENVLVWDGQDERGRVTAPGVYFARYELGRHAGVLKLVKLR